MRQSNPHFYKSYRKLVPFWADFASALPRKVWNTASAPAGLSYAFDNFIHGGAKDVVSTIEEALGRDRVTSAAIFVSSQIAMSRTWLDQSFFFKATQAELTSFAKNNVKVFTHEQTPQEEVLTQPSILLLSAFASHYYGLLALSRFGLRPCKLAIAQPKAALRHLKPTQFYERLSNLLELDIELIEADDVATLVRSLRALKNGRHLALRVDSLPTETTSFVKSSLLGKPSVYPLAILKLAHLSGAPLVSVGVVRKGTKYQFIAAPAVHIRSFEVDDLIAAARKLDTDQGDLIRSHPCQYSAWHGVHQKWRLANEIEQFA